MIFSRFLNRRPTASQPLSPSSDNRRSSAPRLSAVALAVTLGAFSMDSQQSFAYTDPTNIDQETRQAIKAAIEVSDSFYDRYEAEVWLVSKKKAMGKFIDDPHLAIDLLRKIHKAATLNQLQPELVLALIEVESHFDRFAVSRAGAQGMMQIMPFWKNEIGHPEDNLTDIDTNLRYGCAILKHYLDREDGRYIEALARYNGSYGRYWYPRRVMDAWEKNWK